MDKKSNRKGNCRKEQKKMKITMEIPDESVLVTVSIATQKKGDLRNISLGVLPIATADLKDGNTVDLKTPYDNMQKESEDTE